MTGQIYNLFMVKFGEEGYAMSDAEQDDLMAQEVNWRLAVGSPPADENGDALPDALRGERGAADRKSQGNLRVSA